MERDLARDSQPGLPPELRRYFADRRLRTAVRELIRSPNRITLIAGAGVSIEAELPSWDGLVARIIQGIAAERLPAESRDQWVAQVLEPGLTAAGAVAQSLYGPRAFRSRLTTALYRGRTPASFAPGALAQQIAAAKWALGPAMTLATLNYDGLLEQALSERLPPESDAVLSLTEEGEEPAGTAAVFHLHGRLLPGLPTGRIILSDSDYAQVQAGGEWPERFMAEALVDSTCVFVGLSLRDPNIIRWLHRYPGQYPHTAFFVRQGAPHLPLPVRRELEEVTRRRWAAHGVEVVWTNYFGELAQVVHEVATGRSGRARADFHVRSRARLRAARTVVVPRSPRQFRAAQQDLSDLLDDMVRTVRETAASDGIDLSERLGLSLWAVDHEQGLIALWGSSDRYLKRREDVRCVALAYDSPWVAVQTITRGAPVTLDPDLYASRWGLIRGIPVVFDRGEPGQTIVGCLTLASALPPLQSALTDAPAGLIGAVGDVLSREAAQLFRP